MKTLKKTSKLSFKKFLPLFILILVVASFFWKFFLLKQIPFPGDFVVGVYYPWLDYKWGFPAGVPVKNPILADVPSFIYPMQTYAIDLIKNGKLPLWNSMILAGSPLMANFQSAPFSPLNILYFLTDKLTAWSIQIILQHLLAAIFTYILLRYWKVSKLGSIVGGIIFAFSGFNLIWSQWNGHVLSAALIPIIIYFESKFFKEGKYVDGLGFSLSLFFELLSGYPQIVLYTVLAGGLYFILNFNKTLTTRVVILSIFGIMAIGLSAFQTLPGYELLKYSQREVELHPYEWAFLPWTKTITFIAADFFGNHATGNYWGPQDYTSNTGYVGTAAFSLALLSFFFIKKNKYILFASLLAITSLVFAYPTIISISLWKSGFLGLNAASAHRSLILFCLSIGILAGFGIDLLAKIKIKHLIVFLLPISLIVCFGLWASQIKQMIGLKNLILPSVSLASTFIFFVVAYKFSKKVNLIRLLLSLIIIIELFYFGWKFTPFSPTNLIFPKTPILEFLEKQQKPFRVVADKVIPINFLMNYRIETLEGYDAVYPTQTSQYVSSINGNFGTANSIRRYAIIDNYFSNLEDIANAKYFIVLSKDVDSYLKNKKFKIAFADKSVTILENLNVLPRARIENGSVKYLEYQNDESVLEVKATKPGILHISDSYYPGWQAYVDNIPTTIYKVDSIFKGINVPKGDHIIRIVYHPDSFYTGLKISLVSLFLLLACGIIYSSKLYFRK